MGKRSRDLRREAQRAAVALRRERQERRRRLVWFGSAVGSVLVVVAALVIARVAVGGARTGDSSASSAAPASIVQAVTAVPVSVLDKVGLGNATAAPKAIDGQPSLTNDGKPLVLYVGAEYCPYCAAERWAVVVALSRFGSFIDLGATHSASGDIYPNTATLSFHGATYSSDHLAFQAVELQSNVRSGNSYAALDTLTAAQQTLVQKYNAPPYVSADSAGAIPFIDFGNRYLISGASFSPQVLAGMSGEQIAAALSDPASPVARATDGTANAITAVLCGLTNDQPAAICRTPAAKAYQDKL